jgi:hypothetical protein
LPAEAEIRGNHEFEAQLAAAAERAGSAICRQRAEQE